MLLKRFDLITKFRKKVIFSLAVIIVLTVILEIWAVNRLADLGSQITRIEQNKEALLLENQLLENEIATKMSLKDISLKAQNLGYERIVKVEYLEDHNLALVN